MRNLLVALGVVGAGACSGELPVDAVPDDATVSSRDTGARPPADADAATRPAPGDADTPSDTAEPPPLEPGAERPVEVVRTFHCAPEGVGAELVVGRVEGTDDLLVLRPAPATCAFHLYHRRQRDGHETRLSGDGGSGWLFAAGVTLPDGRVVVCANDVHHVADVASGGRWVAEVTLACATTRADGSFGPMRAVVVPGGEWAAWLRALEVDASGEAVVLSWARDFSYQFMNLSDAGRPAEDGVYRTIVTLGADGPAAGEATRIASRVNPLAEAGLTPWEPSESERAELRALTEPEQ